MEPLSLAALVGGALVLIAAGVSALRTQQEQHMDAWRMVATACGMSKIKVSRTGALDRPVLAARSGPLDVRFSAYEHGTDHGTHVLVEADWPPTLAGFSLHPQTDTTAEEAIRREIVVGDDAFDAAYLVEGSPPAVRAWLDADTRRLLLDLHDRGRVMIAHGELRVEIPAPAGTKLREAVGWQLDVARRLARRLETSRALSEHVSRDPLPGVRLQCLLSLTRELAGTFDDMQDVLRTACRDPDPEIRLRAAVELGLEGQGVLYELAERLTDDTFAAQAITALNRRLPPERAVAILQRAVTTRRLEAARACLRLLGKSGGAATLTPLADLMNVDGDLGPDSARALGATGLSAAEQPLVAALAHESPVLRVAAAEALGAVGSAAAVLPLKEAAERHREKELSRATRQAVAAIQERLTGATPGQLSLSRSTGSGQLSIADTTDGRVSLPDGDE